MAVVHPFSEASIVFRHLNELLFIMSLDKYKCHFLKNDNFVSEILVTVHGGGNKRPRNKLTQFCSSVLRFILNLDKMETLSLAEGASKVHSVERLHIAENRALSQDGPISSRCLHTEREQGIWSSKKFMENMNFAREEAIRRLQKVPYSKDTIDGHAPPPTCDWVFQKHYEEKFRKFLQVDDDRHRREHNVFIKPSDPIWNKVQLTGGHCQRSITYI